MHPLVGLRVSFLDVSPFRSEPLASLVVIELNPSKNLFNNKETRYSRQTNRPGLE